MSGPAQLALCLEPPPPAPKLPAPKLTAPSALPSPAPRALTDHELAALAQDYAGRARAPRTLRAYDGDWRRFTGWCEERGRASLPAAPATVALYLTELAHAGRRVTTLRRARAAIAVAHRARGFECPTRHLVVTDLLRGIARTKNQPPERAPALSPEHLDAMLRTLGDDRRGARDRALLALGFAGAFRRSTLVALDVEDLTFVGAGLEVRVRADKGDPAREGRVLPVAFASLPERCAVRAVRAWIDAAALREGPLFRAVSRAGIVGEARLSDRAVDRLVKRAARRAGLALDVSAHSLRAGFITAAVRQKHPLERIRVVSGHKEGSRSFEAYVRFANIWDGYAGEGVL